MGEVKKIQVEAKHGRQLNQKMKPYVVLQYLMKETDENHLVTAYDIVGYLEACGIDAERRSIYKDIEAINRAVLMEGCWRDMTKNTIIRLSATPVIDKR